MSVENRRRFQTRSGRGKRSFVLCAALTFVAGTMLGTVGAPTASAEDSGLMPPCYSKPTVSAPGADAIQQLKQDYFHDVDTKNWDELATHLAPNVIVDTVGSAGPIFPNRDSFIAFTKTTLGSANTHHQGFDPQIRMTSPTTAAGSWTMQDVLIFGNTFGVHGYGHYWECYSNTNGQWVETYSKLTRTRIDLINPDGTVIQADAPLEAIVAKFHQATGL
ncbi:nuclear transport factor 2 family protein [Nocardia sp. NPDC006630]|uniref:nuclear transport factor 2 family protein n=1 Tax=Nocardia sp. NPDC006630 TaxID=3157181 RepID=UPI0033B3E042